MTENCQVNDCQKRLLEGEITRLRKENSELATRVLSCNAQRAPDPDEMNDKRMHEDMTLAHNARKTAIEECARIADEGLGGAVIAEAIRNLDRDYALSPAVRGEP